MSFPKNNEIKYLVYIDYYCEFDNKFVALSAKNLKDAKLEAPALLVDKIFWQATTMIENVNSLKLYKYNAILNSAEYCQVQYITNLCKWEIDNKSWNARNSRIKENVKPIKL